MKKNVKIMTAMALAVSMLSAPVYALSFQTNSKVIVSNASQTSEKKDVVENTMNVNNSEALIANKTVENLNLINELKVNGNISTTVYDNPTTGYTWEFEVTGDKDVIEYTFLDKPSEIKKDDKIDNKPMICGEGAEKLLTIKGLKPGRAKLKMSLVRPWEKDMEPAKIMEFEILVK